MHAITATSQHLAGAEIARAYAGFPCAMNQASWLVTSIHLVTDTKPRSRRHPLTS
jgi:hypothetical protein